MNNLRIWVTPEASAAIYEAAQNRGIKRSGYLRLVIADILTEHRPDLDLSTLLPESTSPVPDKKHHRPGYGRWGKWVQESVYVGTVVPFTLTQIAKQTGDLSMSTLLRRYLADQIERDLGIRVPMPNGAATNHVIQAVI